MRFESDYASLLKLVNSVIPSAFITLDTDVKVVGYHVSNRLRETTRLVGKSFFRIAALLFSKQNYIEIHKAISECRNLSKKTVIRQMQIHSANGESEYYRWHFAPIPNTGVAVFAQNITENVLIENEFKILCEQQAAVNRDLCAAMSTLDFQYMDLEQAHKQLNALYRITSVVQRTVDLNEIFNEIISGLTHQLGYVNAAIFLVDETSENLIIKAHQGYRDNICIPISQGVIGSAFRTREVVYVANVAFEPKYIIGTSRGVAEVAVPLIVDDKVIGVLDVETPEGRVIKAYDLDLLRSLGGQIALTIAHAKHVSNVQVQAVTDSLTGLWNFRYFRTMLDQEFKRAVRYERPLAMLMIDIDNYKHFNDTHGHRMGDEVLKEVANTLSISVRDVDIIARYGGEEFAVLCPETFVDEAMIIAERIRRNIEKYPFPNQHTQPGGTLTVSIGVASYPRDAVDPDTLIDHADLALYSAKGYSKNRVCVYGT